MKKIFYLLLFVLLLTGCTQSPATVNSSPTQSDTGYPAAGVNVSDNTTPGYPASTMAVVFEPTWTIEPGTARVNGVLKLKGKPVKGILLYLGTFLKNKEGQEFTAVVEPSKSPSTNTDQNGNFSFLNLPPGRYALILDNVAKQYLLNKPGTQDYIAIDLPAGTTNDLGTLDYSDLPVPAYNQ